MRRLLLVLVTAAALAAPAVVHAGTPYVLGNVSSSSEPTVTAGDDGVFHVLFNDRDAFLYRYCQVLAGKTGCQKTTLIPFNNGLPTGANGANGLPDNPPDTAWVVVDPDGGPLRIVVPQYVSGFTYEMFSQDDGTTWSAPIKVHGGAVNFIGPSGFRPLLKKDRQTILVPRGTNDGPQIYETSGASNDAEAILDASGVNLLSYNVNVANVPGRTLATADDLDNVYAWSAPDGSPLGVAPSWGSKQLVAAGVDSVMHGGGDDAYLAYTTGAAGKKRFEIRKWGGQAFGAPTVIQKTNGYVPSLYTSRNGTPGVVYRENGVGLRYAQPNAAGKYEPKTIATTDEVFGNVVMAHDDNGRGVAVWPRNGAIAIADLTEVADPSAAAVSTSVTKSGLTIGLNVPGSCVVPGKKVKITTGGQGYAKVKKVTYSFGAKKVTDETNPFAATFTVAKSAKKGQRIAVTSKIFAEKKAPKKKVTFTITSFVDVCGG